MGKNQYEAHKLFYQGLSLLEKPKKIDKAIACIKKSYKLGSPLALFEIAMILRRNDLKDYPQDLNRSDKLLVTAKPILEANMNGVLDGDLATHFYAQYFLHGYAGVEIDEAYGIALEEKVAKNGLVEATEYLITYYSDPEHNNMEKVEYYTKLLEEQKAILASGQRNGVIEMLQEEPKETSRTVEESIEKVGTEETVVVKPAEEEIKEEVKLEKKADFNEIVKLNTIFKTDPLSEEVTAVETSKEVASDVNTICEKNEISEEEKVMEEVIIQNASTETVEDSVEEIETIESKEEKVASYVEEDVEEEAAPIEEITYEEETRPLPKKGKEPTFDYTKFIPVINESSSVEAKIITDEPEDKEPAVKVDLDGFRKCEVEDLYIPETIYSPRERIVLVDPEYSDDELTAEYIATQQILKALNRLDDKDETSLKDAIQLLSEASRVYPIKCFGLLGDIYSNGIYTESNELLAIHYYKSADSNGSAYGAYHLGQIYLDETSESFDKDVGIKFIRKSATLGYGPALDRMGKIYHNGEISLVSYQAAYAFYKLAVERNHRESYLAMAKIDEAKGNNELAEKHRELAAQ